MRWQELSESTIKNAIELFLGEAWGELASSHWPRLNFDVPDCATLVAQFQDERRRGRMRKYTLRLGNRRYPFMKLSLQESLLRDVFFFAVDTHDEMDIKETTPDYSEWEAIRDHNRRTKKTIEDKWRKSGVPTFEDVLVEIERLPSSPQTTARATAARPIILAVDDDPAILKGIQLILERRGYEVTTASSAEDALMRLRTLTPDLILSDFEMGNGQTGIQLAERCRAQKSLQRVPFILATAAEIELGGSDAVDGFLIKPFEVDVLAAFIARHSNRVHEA